MPLSLQLMLTCCVSLVAGYVAAYFQRVSVSSRDRKRISELETEVTTLHSELAKLLQLSKKISQRIALDQHRTTRGASTAIPTEAPPPGDKAAAKAFYLRGRSHAEVARLAMRGGTDGE